MRVSFYKESRVGEILAEKVIKILQELPFSIIEFNDLNNTSFTDQVPWFNEYKILKNTKDKSSIIVYFHYENPWKWYSHIGIGRYKDQRYISVAVSDEIWHNIPNKHSSIAHEILSSILISQVINTQDEYYTLPMRYNKNKGSIIDPLWYDKLIRYSGNIDEGMLQRIKNDEYEAGTEMIQLKIKTADIEDGLIELLFEKGVSEFLIRDVVAGLRALANSNSDVVKRGLHKLKPSRLKIDFATRILDFVDFNKKVKMPQQQFTIYIAYLIAGKIHYLQLRNEYNTLERIYKRFTKNQRYINGFKKLFHGETDKDFRSPKSKVNNFFSTKVFPKSPKMAEQYHLEEHNVIGEFDWCFTEDSRNTLRRIIPNAPNDLRIKYSKIKFCP